jgi:hypothetical protein
MGVRIQVKKGDGVEVRHSRRPKGCPEPMNIAIAGLRSWVPALRFAAAGMTVSHRAVFVELNSEP